MPPLPSQQWLGTFELARAAARRRLPRLVFDYIDGAAETETTMRANRVAFESMGLIPRMGVTEGEMSLRTTVLGHEVAFPLLLSPVGYTRMMHRDGDVAGAAAAGNAGTIFSLSSVTGHRMEDVAAATTGPAWFQLYFLGGRDGAEQLVDRARRAGYGAILVTMDTQTVGKRERDIVNGLQNPLKVTTRNVARLGPKFALKPRWAVDFARDKFRMDAVNAMSLEKAGRPMPLEEATAGMSKFPPRWEDFEWMHDVFKGPIIAKGILSVDDAKRAIDCGVSAIIVSNHGGRQVDGAPASLPALARIADAVGDQVELLMDGGVRRGSDIARALCMGARAVMCGRPWVYGLAAGGQRGVERVLEMFRADLDRFLRILGCADVRALDRSYVDLPPDWFHAGRGV